MLRKFIAIGLALVSVVHAQTQEELTRELDQSSDEHMREELGVNPITTPSIREVLAQLDNYRPVPLEVIAENNRDATFPNRLQTAIHFGTLITDGFMLTLAQRPQDIQDIGRALIRQAQGLGIGERFTRRSKSLFEKSDKGDWIGMREELIGTQTEVEQSLMDLRDEEIAHMISLGGWIRGFQLAAEATTRNYFPTRAQGLINIEIMDYFLDRLDTLHPRIKKTELIVVLTTKLKTLRALAESTAGRTPTKEEVTKMRDLGNELVQAALSKVDDEGKIIAPPAPAPALPR